YREKHGDVVEQAKMVEGAISHAESFTGRSAQFSPRVIDAIVKSALQMFDSTNGGFGQGSEFPNPAVLALLIERYAQTGNEELHEVFATTLERMANGGVYDQLAGGFHRYSVDERWLVPHFEKMCYDNSELLKNYVHAHQATGSEFFADVARDIIRWMDEWLSDREQGGFYASQDADYSMDDDRDYFIWTLEKTVYVGWNAMCVSAYLQAARALKLDTAQHFALRSLDRLLAEGWSAENGLVHVVAYSDPAAQSRRVAGLLDDYAFTAIACLDAYETTSDLSYFNFARRIADTMVDRFFEPASGGFCD